MSLGFIHEAPFSGWNAEERSGEIRFLGKNLALLFCIFALLTLRGASCLEALLNQ